MTPCADWLPLLSDRAAGELAAAEAQRLDTHLAGCAACRAEAEALDAVLSMAALPPTAPAEREALTGLAEAVRLEQRRAELRRRAPLRYAAAALAVAAAVAFLVAPAFTRRAPEVGTAVQLAAAAAAAWEAPDADEIWNASDLAADDGSSAAMSSADELALAVLLADD
jgi:predicted anti-sigma-YlaC factor YlaD